MALQSVPAYIGSTGFEHPAELDRNILKSLFRYSGRIRYGDLSLTSLVGSLGVRIGPGAAFILGTENSSQGGYFSWSEADEDIPWPSPSGSPRYDALVLRVADENYGSIPGLPGTYWDIVQGTPSGSPVVVPDSELEPGGDFYVPGAWWRRADVRVDPSDSVINLANSISSKGMASMPTGMTVAPVPSDIPGSPDVGDSAFILSTKRLGLWDGAAWNYLQSSRVGCRLTRHDQSISSGTQTNIAWNVEREDTNGFHSGSSSDIIIPSGQFGLYLVNFVVRKNLSSNLFGGRVFGEISVTSAVTGVPDQFRMPTDSNEDSLSLMAGPIPLANGDTISCSFYHEHGSAYTPRFDLMCYRMGS